MNNSVLGKTMGNVKKCKNINYLESKPNCHIRKQFSENLLMIEMKQNENINDYKTDYLGLAILDIRRIVMVIVIVLI